MKNRYNNYYVLWMLNNMKNFINSIKKYFFSVGVFGLLISIGYIIYSEFIKDERAKVTFNVISMIKVFDISTKLDNELKVSYKSIDILENNQALTIMNINIINNGHSSILKNYYDEEDPLGFSIIGGEILKINKYSGSTEYLDKKISALKVENQLIKFPSIMFDPSDSISMSIIILQDENSTVSIKPFGKISNTLPFEVKYLYLNTEMPFWNDVLKIYEDNLIIIVLKFFIYFITVMFLLFILMFLIVLPIIAIDEVMTFFSKKSKIKEIDNYKLHAESEINKYDTIIFDYYSKHNLDALNKIRIFYEDKNYNQKILSHKNIDTHYNKYQKLEEQKLEEKRDLDEANAFSNYHEIQQLINNKILNKNGGINISVKKSFYAFMRYLSTR